MGPYLGTENSHIKISIPPAGSWIESDRILEILVCRILISMWFWGLINSFRGLQSTGGCQGCLKGHHQARAPVQGLQDIYWRNPITKLQVSSRVHKRDACISVIQNHGFRGQIPALLHYLNVPRDLAKEGEGRLQIRPNSPPVLGSLAPLSLVLLSGLRLSGEILKP